MLYNNNINYNNRRMVPRMEFVSNIINKENVSDMKNVIRLATQKDLMIYNNNLKDAMEALNMAKKIAVKYNLNMNLIEANYTFERNQLLFFFL